MIFRLHPIMAMNSVGMRYRIHEMIRVLPFLERRRQQL